MLMIIRMNILNLGAIWRELIRFMFQPFCLLVNIRLIIYKTLQKILKPDDVFDLGRHQLRMMLTDDMDCLSALHAVFHELQLVRIQRRPRGPPENRHPRHELLLGDVHSRPEFRNTYRPTAFQIPLLRADQVLTCKEEFRNFFSLSVAWIKWVLRKV